MVLISISLPVCLLVPCVSAEPGGRTTPDHSAYTSDFLDKSEADRIWWYIGAFTMLGHLVSISDKEKGNCIWNWYFKEPGRKRSLIEGTLRKYPKHAPSGVILALLFKDCGEFKVRGEN